MISFANSKANYAPNNSAIDSKFIKSVVPPKGFSPLTATDSELKKYGIPARPIDKEALKRWEVDMSAIKEFVPAEISKVDVKFGNANKRNYAGYLVNTASNTSLKNFTNVSAKWNVPASVNNNYSTGVWVGLADPDTIVQAGTCDFNPDNGGGYGFWYEDLPEGAYRINNVPLAGRDQVSVNVAYDPSDKTTTFFFSNMTQDKATSLTVSTPYYGGTTAEYIVENPYYSSYYENFGTVSFSSCCFTAKTSTGGTASGEFTAYTYDKYTMVDALGNVKGYPGTASNGSFSVVYKP